MEKQKSKVMSRDRVLREMKMWQDNDCSILGEYDTLWEMFKTVVTSSSWGTSEFGGPVWIMDFSLENLKKLFPDNPWIEAMEKEWDKGKDKYIGYPVSRQIPSFSEWFSHRARYLMRWLGLGNVIVKVEAGSCGNVTLYGWGVFLDVVQSLVGGEVNRPYARNMVDWNFSLRESEQVRKGNFFTDLTTRMQSFPCSYGSGFHYFKESETYGKCFRLNHFSLTKGYVIPETQPEKFLMLIVNDLMECKAQGYGNKADKEGTICPYPQMKFAQYLDYTGYCNGHFQPTKDVFRWKRDDDGRIEEIKIDLPEIDAKHGTFWHRQFPPKQNWRVLPET